MDNNPKTRKKILRSYICKSAMVASILVLSTTFSHAGSLIFMKWTGVDGDSTQSNHLREIEITALSGQISAENNGVSQSKAKGCGQFALVKLVDSSSTSLYGFVLSGRLTPTVSISIDKVAGNGLANLSKLNLKNVFVTSVQLAGSEGGLTETVTIQAQSIEILYTRYDNTGRPLPGLQRVAWNCSKNTPFSGVQ